MPAVKEVELIVPQGTTYIYEVTYKDPVSNLPINLTGYSARLQVREKIDSTTVIYEADSTDTPTSDLAVGTTNGKVTLTIPDTVTAAFTFKKAVFDLEIESALGVVSRLVKGTMLLDREVTR